MPQGHIGIVEFRGSISSPDGKRDVTAHLMALDGVFRRKHGHPKFEFLPSAWVGSYRIASYEVGRANSWKDFFEKCNEVFKRELPFERSSVTQSEPESHDGFTKKLSTRGRLKAVLDAVPDRPSRPLNNESEMEQYLDELSEAEEVSRDEDSALSEDAAVLFAELLSEPIERPLSLEFEVSGYMALLYDEVKKMPTIEMSVAAAIANGFSTLLKDFKMSGDVDSEGYRHLQAAVRYFTVSEDANSDYGPGGFDDDAAVFNKVACRLQREELLVKPALILNR